MEDKELSQLDFGGVLKSSHEFDVDSLRTINGISEVPPSYTRAVITYNSSGSATKAVFYKGLTAQISEVVTRGDNSGSLNNTYFVLHTPNNEGLYHVWYNVSGGGTDPALVGSTGIEVAIETNDSATIVALATKICIDAQKEFNAKVSGNKIRITNKEKGPTTSTTDFNTNFLFLNAQLGTEKILKTIDIPFDGNVKYLFNDQEGRFEVTSAKGEAVDVDADTGDTIAISGHENKLQVLDSASFTDVQLSTSTYTEIFSQTATSDFRIRKVGIKVDTVGVVRFKRNGVIQDYFTITELNPNPRFSFIEDLDIANGDTYSVEFLARRLRISNYDFFMRVDGYTP